MAIQAFPFGVFPPPIWQSSASSSLLDASGEKVCAVFLAPKTGKVRKIRFPTGTVTTGQTLKVSFQGVSAADGHPDGVIAQSGTVSVADSDDSVWKAATLDSDMSVTEAALYGIVIEFDSTVGNLNILYNTNVYGLTGGNIYWDHYTGSWAKQNESAPILFLEYDDGSFSPIYGFAPGISGSANINLNSTPDEAGLYFSSPVPLRVRGIHAYLSFTGDADFVLYDSDGNTVLGSASLDKDRKTTSVAKFVGLWTPVTLLKNTVYRAIIKPTTTTSLAAYFHDVPTAAAMDQNPGGQNWHYTQRTDAGAWTQTTTRRPMIALIIDGFDDGMNMSVLAPRHQQAAIHRHHYARPAPIVAAGPTTIVRSVRRIVSVSRMQVRRVNLVVTSPVSVLAPIKKIV